MQKRLNTILAYVKDNRFNKKLVRYFDWPLFILVVLLSLYGVLSIFAATSTPVTDQSASFLEKLTSQPIYYARYQLIWLVVGLVVLAAMLYFDYELFGRLSTMIYWANIAMLVIVLGMEKGRGNMAGWFQWGNERTFQPSEVGKIAIIISLAKLFSGRKRPIRTFGDLLPVLAYIGFPLLLIVAQPDVGTALVYIAIFAGMLFISGTDWRLLLGIVCVLLLLAVPAWYLMNASDSFRSARIQVWLDPNYSPNGYGMQTTNARIAVGSGGLFGKGLFSPGNFASLNYIPDDHTDFIFAIVCETFGFAGAGLMIVMFLLLFLRMFQLSGRAQDAFGSYLIMGVMTMLLFHVFENVCMVIGLMPVTGIPLPFISYGGSNFLTNMLGVGLVLNVSMRSRAKLGKAKRRQSAPAKL